MTHDALMNSIASRFDGEPEFFAAMRQEAYFGYSETAPPSKHMNILEIGAGGCLLSAMLSADGHTIHAVEPISGGFAKSERLLQAVAGLNLPGLNIHRCSIEDLEATTKFDWVIAVNSFEHLPDWKAALTKTYDVLRPGGSAFVLCPNYAFPYESHYGIPIIGSKAITKHLFDRQIRSFDENNDSAGLWNSINMISLPAVRSYCWRAGIPLRTDREISVRMMERLVKDNNFAKRQAAIAPIVGTMKFLGVDRVVSIFQPYMKLIIEKPVGAE